ncbi:MAG: hypothetical protein H6710_12190 [Myxococcales bacterium]|nr:hypothetical protein [Myxococcales bacterium]MCB9700394.1 hypothetical protein [Myxococcales bacterium]
MPTITRKRLIIAAITGLGALGVAQGLFTAGCDAELGADDGGDVDGSGGGGESGQAQEEQLTLQERLLKCEESKPSKCPGEDDSGLKRHEGLTDAAICQFKLVDQDFWGSKGGVVDDLGKELELVDAAGILKDLDKKGKKIEETHDEMARLEVMYQAFGWDSFDHGDKAWRPQGVSGSADASDDELIAGRKVMAVSWYHLPENTDRPSVDKGSRISFVDITDLPSGDISYTHALLVDPYDNNGTPDFRPVRLHVGGVAWVGKYIYAVDTMKGLRLFDTSRMIKMNSTADEAGRDSKTGEYRAYGHRYAIPQVGAYLLTDDSCWHRFSFIALDKTSDPPALVTGEFHSSDIAGKLLRWDLDGELPALTDRDAKIIQPSSAYYSQESDMQGGISIKGEWYLSSSGQDGNWGLLYRTGPTQKSESYGWVIGPEDLMYSNKDKALWSASEFAGRRYVFSVDIGKY